MKQFLFTLFILLVGVGFTYSQKSVSGTVTDEAGTPLIGANVVAKETSGVGTITDIDGNFKLQLPQNVNVLVFSYAGYNTQEIEVGTSTTINVTLTEGKLLEEIVVVGYGAQAKKRCDWFNFKS